MVNETLQEKILKRRAKRRVIRQSLKIIRSKNIYYTFYDDFADFIEDGSWLLSGHYS